MDGIKHMITSRKHSSIDIAKHIDNVLTSPEYVHQRAPNDDIALMNEWMAIILDNHLFNHPNEKHAKGKYFI